MGAWCGSLMVWFAGLGGVRFVYRPGAIGACPRGSKCNVRPGVGFVSGELCRYARLRNNAVMRVKSPKFKSPNHQMEEESAGIGGEEMDIKGDNERKLKWSGGRVKRVSCGWRRTRAIGLVLFDRALLHFSSTSSSLRLCVSASLPSALLPTRA